jgi:hypothetical protein
MPTLHDTSTLEKWRAQLERDTYPRWSALTWARTHLLQMLTPVVLEQLHAQSKGVVREIAAAGLESILLRSVGNISQSQAGHVYVEVRMEASIRFVDSVDRKTADAARALRWIAAETPFLSRWMRVHQIVILPIDVLVTFHPDGKFKEIELHNFAYGRGLLGRRR